MTACNEDHKRWEYRMLDEDYALIRHLTDEIIEAQKKAQQAWKDIGERMGFKYQTVRPVPGEDKKVFTAEPTNDHPVPDAGEDEGVQGTDPEEIQSFPNC
jgi:hypothetical protein